ncbi:hypothetical protein BH10BAC5_BH10BAC5_13100 [soil metagenome]
MTETNNPDPNVISDKDKSDGKVMAILAYLGILVFIPLLTQKHNRFVMFHVQQGLGLFIAWLILWFLFMFVDRMIFSRMMVFPVCGGSLIYGIVKLGLFILMILGIINAAKGEMKELPVVGSLARSFNIYK